MKGMRNNFDFIGATMTTRGKGSSQGDAQAFGYDCKDIYELANHLKTLLSGYYDPAQ
ncbi:MAG: hypothetical protein LBD11_00505 [Candidatus Peribacteria bacterium]|jgi:hypothetical protein|nr:hypothetical protein [Candidatus Peribacteria bacterium]